MGNIDSVDDEPIQVPDLKDSRVIVQEISTNNKIFSITMIEESISFLRSLEKTRQ